MTPDTCYLTPDTWHVTHDPWHVTCDIWWGVTIISRFGIDSVLEILNKRMTEWMTELIKEWMIQVFLEQPGYTGSGKDQHSGKYEQLSEYNSTEPVLISCSRNHK